MEISKLKDQGVLLKTKNATVAIDPLLKDGSLPADAADCDFIISSTPEIAQDKYGDDKRIFSWPGEYEIKGVAVHARPTNGYDKEHKSNLLYVMYTDEGKICYLPALKKDISSEVMEAIGDIELLIFPAIGDEKLWNATLESIEPKAFLPLDVADGMSLDALFARIGMPQPERTAKITVKNKNELSVEKMTAFLLD